MNIFRFPLPGALLLVLALGASSCSRTDTKEVKPDASAKAYPLDTCLVCEMKLSAMAEPFVFVYNGQQIKVCDAGEKAEFEKDPAKYLKKLDNAPEPRK